MNKKQTKKLYRSKEDKIIAGVCGGIADYFSIDPVWVRLITLLLFFIEGFGLIAYILAWILIPENPTHKNKKKTFAEKTAKKVHYKIRSDTRKCRDGGMMVGIIFIILGVILLMKKLFVWFSFSYIWPLLIIALGVYLITRRNKK